MTCSGGARFLNGSPIKRHGRGWSAYSWLPIFDADQQYRVAKIVRGVVEWPLNRRRSGWAFSGGYSENRTRRGSPHRGLILRAQSSASAVLDPWRSSENPSTRRLSGRSLV